MTTRMLRWQRAARILRQAWAPFTSHREPNEALLYREMAWMGITTAIANTFVGVFAARLGASNQLLGLLVSLPALVGILWQLPAARLVERQPRRMPIMLASFLAQRLGYLLIAILPWLLHLWRAEAVVAITVLMAVPGTVANIAFTSTMGEVVAADRRATVVNARNMILSLTMCLTSLAAGRLLDLFPFPINYQGAFLIGFAASILSVIELTHIRVQGEESSPAAGPRPTVPWRSILGNRRFILFALAFFGVQFGLALASPLFTIYRVRTLNAPNTVIGLIGAIEVGSTVLFSFWWGRRASKLSNSLLVLIGYLGWSFYPLLTSLTRRPEQLLAIAVLVGVFNPPYVIGQFNLLMDVCPSAGRPTYIGLYNVMINAAGFLAPLLGAALADSTGIHTALVLASVVRWTTAGLFALLLRGCAASKVAPA